MIQHTGSYMKAKFVGKQTALSQSHPGLTSRFIREVRSAFVWSTLVIKLHFLVSYEGVSLDSLMLQEWLLPLLECWLLQQNVVPRMTDNELKKPTIKSSKLMSTGYSVVNSLEIWELNNLKNHSYSAVHL